MIGKAAAFYTAGAFILIMKRILVAVMLLLFLSPLTFSAPGSCDDASFKGICVVASDAGSNTIDYGNADLANGVVPVPGRITGMVGDPRAGSSGHHGIDIAAVTGTPIKAFLSGTVVRASANGGVYGNVVDVEHGNGYKTRYAHLNSIAVSAGQAVGRGAPIGTVGSTGRSTGPHLHFELYQNGQLLNPCTVFGCRRGSRVA